MALANAVLSNALMKPLSECCLYAFVDTAYLHGRPAEIVAQQLCDGGADLIQLRAKNASAEEVRRLAEKILPVTRAARIGLVINDHLSLASELAAEFCHLGQEDFAAIGQLTVTGLFSEGAPPSGGGNHGKVRVGIGLSTHAPDQAERALQAQADYIAIGPVYATGTKPTAKPVTLGYVRWAATHISIPWFAIGGINLYNLVGVRAAGAKLIGVVSAIITPNDIRGACEAFKNRLITSSSGSSRPEKA
jgi:thiamine-phosphate pyrophosphorylase